jgi:FMN phosphatase YigB (HAD superfamily)
MVGDRYNRDVAGAHAAGMRAILIKIWDSPIPDGARPPEAVIDSIAELPEALSRLENA